MRRSDDTDKASTPTVVQHHLYKLARQFIRLDLRKHRRGPDAPHDMWCSDTRRRQLQNWSRDIKDFGRHSVAVIKI
ncbi:hypothetical protein MN0502_07460 [Arthrobacter sp. MN05-02]|nr:hypothetical protein MN0502_07460 [Arthrobacter sp. MN05-02]